MKGDRLLGQGSSGDKILVLPLVNICSFSHDHAFQGGERVFELNFGWL